MLLHAIHLAAAALFSDRRLLHAFGGWLAAGPPPVTSASQWLTSLQERLALPSISELPAGAGYGLIFAVGIMTSFHCAGMCGGIALAQTAGGQAAASRPGFLRRLKPALPYHIGRILSYAAIGALAGGLGQVIRLPGLFRGAVPVFGGLFMIVMGINLLGVWKFLRKLNLRMPAFAARRLLGGASRPGPLAVGLLSGLMPCGPLQIMQLYALASGSVWHGFASLLVFSLGTAPMLLLFSALSTMGSKTFATAISRFSAVIVIFLGVTMLSRGLALSGIGLSPSQAAFNTSGIAAIGSGGKEQTVRTSLDPDHRDSYPPIVVQKGIPVRWIFTAEKQSLDSCNETVVLPVYRVEQRLVPGDNLIRFTPKESGEFVYTCWMGMIKSRILVVDDLAAYVPAQAGSASAPSAVSAQGNADKASQELCVVTPYLPVPQEPGKEPAPSQTAEAARATAASPAAEANAAKPDADGPVPEASLPASIPAATATPSPAGHADGTATPAAASAQASAQASPQTPPATAAAASPAGGAAIPAPDSSTANIQTVITTVSPNSYSPITVKKGIPVKWIIRAKAEDLNECNNSLTVPALKLEAKLEAGDTILEFTPAAAGEYPFTCWMDMIKSTITVVE